MLPTNRMAHRKTHLPLSQNLKMNLRRRRDLNPRGGFIPLPLSRRVPWTGLGDASQINGSSTQISKHYLYVQNSFNVRAEGVGFEPTRSVNPFRFSRPVPSATRRALQRQYSQFTFCLSNLAWEEFDLDLDSINHEWRVNRIYKFIKWLTN